MLLEIKNSMISDIDKEISSLKNRNIKTNFSIFDKVFKQKKVNSYIDQSLSIQNRIATLQKQKENILNVHSLSFDSICPDIFSYVREHQLSFTINDSDILNNQGGVFNYINDQRAIQSLQDLVLIHKTDFYPTHDTIQTALSTHARSHMVVQINHQKHEIPFSVANNSIHFSVNGPVGSHMYGSWDSRKYAIVVPFQNLNLENLIGYRPEDTYFEGNVHISGPAYLLCPVGEKEKIQKANTYLQVLEYENISLDDATQSLLFYLGYKLEKVSNNNWINHHDSGMSNSIVQDAGIPLASPHVYSNNYVETALLTSAHKFAALFHFIKSSNLPVFDKELSNALSTCQPVLFGANELSNKQVFTLLSNLKTQLLILGYDFPNELFSQYEELLLSKTVPVSLDFIYCLYQGLFDSLLEYIRFSTDSENIHITGYKK